jgi:hypothetical protein
LAVRAVEEAGIELVERGAYHVNKAVTGADTSRRTSAGKVGKRLDG